MVIGSVTAVGGTREIPEIAANFSSGGFSNYVSLLSRLCIRVLIVDYLVYNAKVPAIRRVLIHILACARQLHLVGTHERKRPRMCACCLSSLSLTLA